MKKLLAVILIMGLILPAAALAEDVVGSWYMLYDKTIVPEMASSFNNCDLIVATYSFMPDGTIILTENDITAGESEQHCGPAGKWEANGTEYTYSIVGLGSGKAYVKDGMIYLELQNNVFLKLRHMDPYDPYGDYVY